MTKPLKNACTVCSVQAFYFTKVWIPCLDEALTIILQLSELGNMDHLEPEKRSKMPLKQQDQS